jgi:hypothetical protein
VQVTPTCGRLRATACWAALVAGGLGLRPSSFRRPALATWAWESGSIANALEDAVALVGHVDDAAENAEELEEFVAFDSSVEFFAGGVKLSTDVDFPILWLSTCHALRFVEKATQSGVVVPRESGVPVKVDVLAGLIAKFLEQRVQEPVVAVVTKRKSQLGLSVQLVCSDAKIDAHRSPNLYLACWRAQA